MNNDKFGRTIDIIQQWLVWFVIGVITFCIAVLFLFDVLAGTGTMLFLTGGKEWQSVVISLATTGLLFALMFIGYMMVENKSSFIKQVGLFILVVAGLIYLEDIIFDALLADVLRYGTISLHDTDVIQWMFRFLLGGISTVGDALAIAMILGLPVLKNIIGKALQPTTEPQRNHQHQQNNHHRGSIDPQLLARLVKSGIPTNQSPRMENGSEPTYHQVTYKNAPKPKKMNFE